MRCNLDLNYLGPEAHYINHLQLFAHCLSQVKIIIEGGLFECNLVINNERLIKTVDLPTYGNSSLEN